MTLAQIPDLLHTARTRRGGVAAFNVITLEHIEAIISAAERVDSPVVVQISQNCVRFHGSLAPLATAALASAARASVPVVVHLDHADDEVLVAEAVELGVPSVMFDASASPYDENVERTSRVVDVCHALGVSVEAELGKIGGKDGVHAPGARTDPEEAKSFVLATGVDSLAVAVGSSHAKAERDLAADIPLIERLHDVVPVPLVLHGSSSLSDQQIGAAIRAGITKVNIATHLNGFFTNALRGVVTATPHRSDPRLYLAPARSAMSDETQRLFTVLSTTS